MPTSPLAPGVGVGVTEEMISDLVDAFYAKVRRDEMLGPIFNSEIKNWTQHLANLCAFWSSVTLMSGRYKGAPMSAHIKLSGIGGAHFERWLELFARTAQEICPPAAAALFIERSERIAGSLQRGIAMHRGVLEEAHHDHG